MRTTMSAVAGLLCLLGLCAPTGLQTKAAAAPIVQHARATTPKLDSPVARGRSVVFTGRARPRSVVYLQRRGSARWHTLQNTRASATGRFRVLAARPGSSARYRVVSLRRASIQRTVSKPKPPTPPTPAPVDACGPRPKRADGSYYECTFTDEFDGASLDTAKWLVQETSYSGMTTAHHDCYVNDSDTVAVGDGVLRLTSRRNLADFECTSPYGNFTTSSTAATVATRSRFTQTYGRFSFRAKMPPMAGVPGSGSGLWLYPEKHTYGAWPRSGEIDVAEWFSANPAKAYPSVHYEGEPSPKTSGQNCDMPTASTAFHTYTVEWSATQMRFSYDDKVCFTWDWRATANMTGAQPFDQPFYNVITQAWGAAWNAPTAATPNSATLTVDWVRAWR